MSLPNYDSWKLASPPEYDTPDCCPSCGRQLVDAHECSCGWNEYEAIDSARDDALDPACAAGRK